METQCPGKYNCVSIQISTLLKNDTIVEPSKPKFTAPLFGKERPQMAIDTISAASSPKINEIR